MASDKAKRLVDFVVDHSADASPLLDYIGSLEQQLATAQAALREARDTLEDIYLLVEGKTETRNAPEIERLAVAALAALPRDGEPGK